MGGIDSRSLSGSPSPRRVPPPRTVFFFGVSRKPDRFGRKLSSPSGGEACACGRFTLFPPSTICASAVCCQLNMLSTPTRVQLGSSALTAGVRVAVQPRFLPEQSDPTIRQYIFAYQVKITNEGDVPVRLISRYWVIVDAQGRSHEVRGEGVVGQQPRIMPGESHEYSSYCPLPTTWGTMEGLYHMRRDDGTLFDAKVARFYLVAPRDEQ